MEISYVSICSLRRESTKELQKCKTQRSHFHPWQINYCELLNNMEHVINSLSTLFLFIVYIFWLLLLCIINFKFYVAPRNLKLLYQNFHLHRTFTICGFVCWSKWLALSWVIININHRKIQQTVNKFEIIKILEELDPPPTYHKFRHILP